MLQYYINIAYTCQTKYTRILICWESVKCWDSFIEITHNVQQLKNKQTDNDIVSTPDAYITRARALHGNSVNENVHNYWAQLQMKELNTIIYYSLHHTNHTHILQKLRVITNICMLQECNNSIMKDWLISCGLRTHKKANDYSTKCVHVVALCAPSMTAPPKNLCWWCVVTRQLCNSMPSAQKLH